VSIQHQGTPPPSPDRGQYGTRVSPLQVSSLPKYPIPRQGFVLCQGTLRLGWDEYQSIPPPPGGVSIIPGIVLPAKYTWVLPPPKQGSVLYQGTSPTLGRGKYCTKVLPPPSRPGSVLYQGTPPPPPRQGSVHGINWPYFSPSSSLSFY
jgi:hypothetical protein